MHIYIVLLVIEHMRVEQKHVIRAVHQADVSDILEQFGQLEDLKSGTYRCTVCSSTLTLTNLGSMKRVSDRLVFTCDKLSCRHYTLFKT